MPTIKDVAKACDLSVFTVSAVLNNRHGEASAKTRERVLRVVEEMGYQRNAVARGLSMRRMNTIGVVLAYADSPSLASHHYVSPVFDGIISANRHHKQRTLVMAEVDWDDVCANLDSYLDGHSDALIFLIPTASAPTEMFLKLARRKFPFVIVGEDRPDEGLSILDLDNVMAGYDAASHLIRLGHRKIAMLTGNTFFLSSSQRESGFRQAMEENNLFVDETMVLSGRYQETSGYERASLLLARPEGLRPTAVVCGDDAIAHGVLRAAEDLKIGVPERLSVIGVNNDEQLRPLRPDLTTIDHPLRRMGEISVEIVLKQISGEAPEAVRTLVRGEVTVRNTTAVPPPEIDRVMAGKSSFY